MVQKQVSDAISIIGKRDFPRDWPGLLQELTAKLQSGDFHAINGVLQTAHSLFKKYRCVGLRMEQLSYQDSLRKLTIL